MTIQMLLSLILVFQLSVGMAATPVIGVATAKGSFRLDNTPVSGNGTVFEGSVVETSRVAGELQLVGGVRMQLGAESRGRIYRDRAVLERGAGQISSPDRYGVEAKSLRILAEDAGSVGRILVTDDNRVQVAALRGSFRVTNSNGILIAALPAGRALEFEPPQSAGAAAPSTLTGCLAKRDGHYFLTDETAGVTVELKGGALDQHAGHKIEVTGSQVPAVTPAGDATQVIQVSSLKVIAKRCSAGGAAAAGAAAGGAAAGGAAAGAGGAAAGAATAAGAGIATKAIVAGVIVAAAATGTAVAITAGEDEATISR